MLECHVQGEFQRTGAARCLGHEQSALQRAHQRQRELGLVGLRGEFAFVAHGFESLGQVRLPFGEALREHAPRGLGLVGQFAHERAQRAAPGTLRRDRVVAPALRRERRVSGLRNAIGA